VGEEQVYFSFVSGVDFQSSKIQRKKKEGSHDEARSLFSSYGRSGYMFGKYSGTRAADPEGVDDRRGADHGTRSHAIVPGKWLQSYGHRR